MLKRIAFVLTVVTLVAGGVKAGTWQVDPNHSSIGFSVRHMVISNVKGNFQSFSGQADFDPANLSKGTAEFSIDAASITTANERRDGDLRVPISSMSRSSRRLCSSPVASQMFRATTSS